jgi:membrane-bound serine protease (ClpP class)
MFGDILLIVILVLGGLALILAEIITTFFGTLSLAALACFVYAVYRAFQLSPTAGVGLIIGLLIGLPVYVVYLVRWLPGTRLGRKLTLGDKPTATGTQSPTEADTATMIGAEGQTVSALRPSGTVRIGPRRLTARAESGFIPSGTAVKVISASGYLVVVRPLAPAADQAPPTQEQGEPK